MKTQNSQVKSEALVGFSNEIAIGDDGWAMIAPFGDFPSMAVVPQADGSVKRVTALQRIDKKGATEMVNEFTASRKGIKRYFAGRPIYVGHPDVPGIGSKYPDKAPKGVIADLAVREDGLYGMPVFTNEGSDLVESKQLRYFSGRLADCEEDGAMDGIPVFRPRLFISVGLTNKPHLPVQMLNEADEAEGSKSETNTTMKKKLIALCATFGIQLANEADDAATEAALDQLGQKAAQAAQLANEKETLTKKLTSAVSEKIALTTARDAAQAAFANERKAFIKFALDGAIISGRITAAERETWENRLGVEANFANELEALSKLEPKLKTASVTLQRGDRKIELANGSDRREMVAELVNEEIASSKCNYDTAFAKVQKRFPQLFEAMQQPGRK